METHDKRVEDMQRRITQLFKALGHDQRITVGHNGDEDLTTLSLTGLGLFVDVGYEVERTIEASLTDPCDRTVSEPGYRVGLVIEDPGDRDTPPDYEDVTVLETTNAFEALHELAALWVGNILDAMSESEYAAECAASHNEE